MKTIYLDDNFKCHTFDDGTMMAFETDFFDGKCDVFIEGYRFIPKDGSWTRSDGIVFRGEMITPWKPYNELDAIQRAYEQQLITEYEAELAELDAALLEVQYQNLIGGV